MDKPVEKTLRLIFELPETRSSYKNYIDADCIQVGLHIDSSLTRSDIDIPNHDELTVVRHYTNLSRLNMSVDANFYPLGSCTMKYNPKINEYISTDARILDAHPYTAVLDIGLCEGLLAIMAQLNDMLCKITGMSAFTFQPMAGANGELTGMLILMAYLKDKGELQRKNILIPDSAHGTNPASSRMAGFNVINIKTTEGYLKLSDIAPYLDEKLAGVMLTMPNTLGLFNPEIDAIAAAVHKAGGFMYYDGANFNALMGLIKPADIGFDIIHLNLHKSFSTPHGAGGPGAGPVGVAERFAAYLPFPYVNFNKEGEPQLISPEKSIGKIAPFFGNYSVLAKTFVYLKMLGIEGLAESAKAAVLSANYLRCGLKDVIDIPYDRVNMHEFVASSERLKKEKGITAIDIAKGLIDFGIHPPTVYFPLIVKEALMIEPTETESLFTLNGFIDIIKKIAGMPKDALSGAPYTTVVSRLDETKACREIDVCYG